MRERSHALRRQNLQSSVAGAVAGAIVVGLLAAIDPAIPFASVALRAAGAFALGATVGLTLSSLSYSLQTIRSREVSVRTGHRDAPPAPPTRTRESHRIQSLISQERNPPECQFSIPSRIAATGPPSRLTHRTSG